MKTFFKWLILSGSVFLSGVLVAGVFVDSVWVAILAGAGSLFINTIIKPVAKFITLPLTIISFGLFGFVLNAIFYYLLALIIPGFTIVGFVPALIGSIIVSIFAWISDKVLG